MDADKEGSGYSHYRSSLECGGQEIANADYYPDKLLINKNINKNNQIQGCHDTLPLGQVNTSSVL